MRSSGCTLLTATRSTSDIARPARLAALAIRAITASCFWEISEEMSDMASPYKLWSGLKSHPLGVQALALREAYNFPCRLSPLIAMSDPVRTSNILDWAEHLPENCAIIYRFNTLDEAVAKQLRKLSKEKNQQLLLRQKYYSPDSDGLHFKRYTDLKTIENIRETNPKALLTLAALKDRDYDAPLPPLDGLLVSAIFPSASPSAGEPIGTEGLKDKVQKFKTPVFALGGVNTKTAPTLLGTGIAGIAVVGALANK